MCSEPSTWPTCHSSGSRTSRMNALSLTAETSTYGVCGTCCMRSIVSCLVADQVPVHQGERGRRGDDGEQAGGGEYVVLVHQRGGPADQAAGAGIGQHVGQRGIPGGRVHV